MAAGSNNFPASVHEWRQKLQATAPEGERRSVVHRFARFVSIYFTIPLARTPLTPNQITAISVVLFLAGISLFVLRDVAPHLMGAGLVFLSIVLDQCDGEIARLKGNPSKAGPYVEPVSHDIQYGLMFVPVTLGLYWAGHGMIIVYAGFAATIFKLWTRLIETRFLGLNEHLGLFNLIQGPIESSPEQGLLRRAYFYINRDLFSSVGMVLPLAVFAGLERMDVFVWLFASWYGLMFLARFARQVRFVSRLYMRFGN